MNAKTDKIIEALGKLDAGNDNHWTSEGLPKLDALKFSIGESVTREEVNTVAPGYTRSNPFFAEPVTEQSAAENVETEQPQVGAEAGSHPELSEEKETREDGGVTPITQLVKDEVIHSLSVEVKVEDLLKGALETLPTDFASLTHEEALELREQYTAVIHSESILEDNLRRLVLARQHKFNELCEHVERTQPKTKLNDQLNAFRDAVAASSLEQPINRPRQIIRQGRGGYGR